MENKYWSSDKVKGQIQNRCIQSFKSWLSVFKIFFVLPSFEEPLGIALEETMGYGLVPVARKSGGVPEIWPLNYEEFLVNPEPGHHYIQKALEKILSFNDQELLITKQKVQIHASKTFHVDVQAKKFEKMILGKVLSKSTS